MNKETHEKLLKAIEKHNAEQQNEQDKVDLQEVLMEIGQIDSEELEKATQKIKENFETRNKDK